MAIINTGILIIAFKKYWKSLYYSSFVLSWIIFLGWYVAKFEFAKNVTIASTFLTVFFLIFYAIFLGIQTYKEGKI
jgi:uncharacterized membrane protein